MSLSAGNAVIEERFAAPKPYWGSSLSSLAAAIAMHIIMVIGVSLSAPQLPVSEENIVLIEFVEEVNTAPAVQPVSPEIAAVPAQQNVAPPVAEVTPSTEMPPPELAPESLPEPAPEPTPAEIDQPAEPFVEKTKPLPSPPPKQSEKPKKPIKKQSLPTKPKPPEAPSSAVAPNGFIPLSSVATNNSNASEQPKNQSTNHTSDSQEKILAQTYARTLMLWIKRFQIYPRKAQIRGIEGNVILRIRVDRTGRLTNLGLVKKAHDDSLNDAAVLMANRADPYPEPPSALVGQEIEVLLPIEFTLQETD